MTSMVGPLTEHAERVIYVIYLFSIGPMLYICYIVK